MWSLPRTSIITGRLIDIFLSKVFTSTEGFIILEGPDGSLLSAKLRDVKKVLRVLVSLI